MTPTPVVLGVPVDDVTMAEAVDRIAHFVRSGRRLGRSYQVATVNADFVVNTFDDEEALALLQRSDLSIPDGMPVVWGSKLLKAPLRERVTGVDLLPALAERGDVERWTIYLFGAAPGIAQRAAVMLRNRHPGVTVIADEGPKLADVGDMDDDALDAIRSARPDIVCVALGNPKQERWIARYRNQLGVPVLIGVGGTFDLMVGDKRRAPAWMRRTGFEWLFRAAQEPRRLARRYAHDIVTFLPRLGRQAWTFRTKRAARWVPATIQSGGGEVTVQAIGRLTAADLAALGGDEAHAQGSRLVVDLSGVPFVDNATASCLAALARSTARMGASMEVRGVGTQASRCLRRLRLDGLVLDSAAPSGTTAGPAGP